MQKLNREQWLEWRNHPVTEALNQAIKERIQETKDQLSDPDSSPERDRLLKGMIWAFEVILNAKPDLLDALFQEEQDEV